MTLQKKKNNFRTARSGTFAVRALCVFLPLLLAAGCTDVNVPDGRSVLVPNATPPLDRFKGLNEERDPVTRVKLGRDILVPQKTEQDPLPEDTVGPYELRNETLASALQLVLDDYDASLAFETDKAMTTRISVANLHGGLGQVVQRMCDLANMYCSYKDHVITVKDKETFVVDLPPLPSSSNSSSGTTSSSSSGTSNSNAVSANGGTAGSTGGSAYDQIATGLKALVGTDVTVDTATRVMIYTATQRAQKSALKYFQRLRKNTALIIYETHIWEVTLSNNNRTGIDWSLLYNKGNFKVNLKFPGGAPSGTASPISITPSYTGSSSFTPAAVLDFISERGTVRTVSQPQLTVLSGSKANLQVQQSENFVSGVQRTVSTTPGVPDTVSTTTQTVQTGLSMSVESAWDQSTVYGTIDILINELLSLDKFNPDVNTTIQLPKTTSRGLQTQVRVRPGDAILIGGLVTQKDNYSASGPGFTKPIFPTARETTANNTELVFLLRPRVVIFTPGDDTDTPPAVDAPKDGYRPEHSGNGKNHSPLPDGISPTALSPVGPGGKEISGEKTDKDAAPAPLALPEGSADELAPTPPPAPSHKRKSNRKDDAI
jgi:hypothetical protein